MDMFIVIKVIGRVERKGYTLLHCNHSEHSPLADATWSTNDYGYSIVGAHETDAGAPQTSYRK